jgi:hypothetical protein
LIYNLDARLYSGVDMEKKSDQNIEKNDQNKQDDQEGITRRPETSTFPAPLPQEKTPGSAANTTEFSWKIQKSIPHKKTLKVPQTVPLPSREHIQPGRRALQEETQWKLREEAQGKLQK